MTQESFLEIYDEYMPKIFRHVFARVSDQGVVEDIVSETFLKAWDFVRQGGEVANLKAFCYTIANHLIIDFYRKKYRKDVSLEYAEEVPDSKMDGARMEAQVDVSLLKSLLASLPEEQAAILSYRYVDDMEIGDIAGLVGKTSANVYVIIHRALKALKKKIAENEPS